MSSNITTGAPLYTMIDLVTVYGICVLSTFGCILLSLFITTLICISKPLHSPANLLVANGCLAGVFCLSIVTVNLSYYVIQIPMSDWQCRIQAYIYYVFLTMVSYSYLIQSISRLFFTILSRYRKLLTVQSHWIFIILQIFISLLFPLPSLITKDIVYRSFAICLIPMRFTMHVTYFFLSSYLIPLFVVFSIHLVIRRHVQKSSRASRQAAAATKDKRALELTKHIFHLSIIFFLGGIPGLVYVTASIFSPLELLALYAFSFSAVSVALLIEKSILIFLNKEIRKEARQHFGKLVGIHQATIEPFAIGTRMKLRRTIK